MQDFYLYILCCADGSYYIGHTDNLEQRLDDHVRGSACTYTKERRPVHLVFSQPYASRDEAFCAERKIKGWSRAKKEAFIKQDWKLISQLAKKNKKNSCRPSIRPRFTRATQDDRSWGTSKTHKDTP